MKKLIPILLVLFIFFAVAPSANADSGLENFKKTATYNQGQFSDVAATDWYASSVKAGYEYGLIKGTSDTTFNPSGNITLAEAITMAARLHSIYYTGAADFVLDSPWYKTYVDYALENGIISAAYPDYNAKATRAQFVAIFAKALPAEALPQINSVATGSLPDVSGTEPYGPAVYKLYNAGILAGNDAYGTFAPASNIKRSEVAAITTRMANTSLRKAYTLSMSPELLKAIKTRSDEVLDCVNEGMARLSDCLTSIKNGSHSIALAWSAFASNRFGFAITACGDDPYFATMADRLRLVRSKLYQLHIYSTGSKEISQKIVDIIKECLPILQDLYKEVNGEYYMLIGEEDGDLTYLSLSTGKQVVNP
ncbi:MAG: S-layer homology domain-containing protein [Firmicutes bacterium]|nr:S-layer homology domain-containing protein [Bacillota bacterium]